MNQKELEKLREEIKGCIKEEACKKLHEFVSENTKYKPYYPNPYTENPLEKEMQLYIDAVNCTDRPRSKKEIDYRIWLIEQYKKQSKEDLE